MPPGAAYSAAQEAQRRPSCSAPLQRGQASSARASFSMGSRLPRCTFRRITVVIKLLRYRSGRVRAIAPWEGPMKRTLLVASLLFVPAAAFAEMGTKPVRSTSIEFGLRAAYAIPFGKSTDSQGDEVYGGLYFSYGFASLGDPLVAACGSASCSAHTLRVGLQMDYHFVPWGQYDPWLGASLGYEQASASGPGGDATISGFEFLNVQFGVGYRVSSLFAIGPFLGVGIGQFSHVDAGGTSGSISNTALHGWMNFGLRMSFTP